MDFIIILLVLIGLFGIAFKILSGVFDFIKGLGKFILRLVGK